MKTELDNNLVRDFPLLYADRSASLLDTCMCWGFECDDGWEPLIRELSSKLEPLIKEAINNQEQKVCVCGEHAIFHENRVGKCFRTYYIPIKKPKWLYRWCLFSVPISIYESEKIRDKIYVFWRKLKSSFGIKVDKLLHILYKCGIHEEVPSLCMKYQLDHPRASQVKEKYGCYDEQTEVLTENGWKFFKDVIFSDKIATLQNNEKLEYQCPTDIINYKYDGLMYRLKTRGVDILVTPNHNLYAAKGTYYNGRYNPPKKVEYPFELTVPEKYFLKNKCFKKNVLWEGKYQETFFLPEEINEWEKPNFGSTRKVWKEKSLSMNKWLNFLGWYVAEGCSDSDRGQISIACNNTDGGLEKSIINEAISGIEYEIKTSMEDRSALTFNIYEKRLSKWLVQYCGSCSYNKKVPNFIKELPPEQIKIFLNSLYAGDGHKTDTSYILTTVSRQLADDAQELIFKAGYTSKMYSRPPSSSIYNGKTIQGTTLIYEVNWLLFSNTHNTSNKGLSPSSIEEWQPYNGNVYCVTVPNHIIYIRRNGIPVWCGNSLRFYMTTETKEMHDLIREYEKKSVTTCEMCGDLGVLYGGGWLRTLCEPCAIKSGKKKLK